MEKKDNPNKTIISSLVFKLLERCGYQGVAFVVQIILARLLDPTDYGVLTILTVFIAVSQVFVQSGLNTALIQRKDVTDKDFSSVFYISLTISVVIYGGLFFSAGFIADFYKMPQLKNILRVLALILIPGAFNSIQNAKIAREMRFKQLMFCTFGAVIVSGTVGITMAYMGFGVWALVWQQLSNQISICILMLFVVKWRPKFVCEINRVKVLFSFGWKLLCSSLIDTIYQNLQSLVIGKKYDSGTLGYFNRGRQFPDLIITNINGAIQSVMLPALSKQQDDKLKMKSMMRRSIVTSSFIIFPMLTILAVCADSLISILLTDKWLSCVPYLRIFCFIYAFWPIHTANLQAINAMGRSDLFLKLEVIKKSYGLITLVITVFLFESPMAIAMGSAVTTIISCFVNAAPNKKLLNYSYFEQMKDIIPQMVCSFVMAALIYCVKFLELSNVLTLAIQCVSGGIIYIFLSEIFKLECYLYIKNMVLKKMSRKKAAE